jgi:hypothetical protein
MAKEKKKTSSVEDTTRNETHRKAKEIIEETSESETPETALVVNLSPVQKQKLDLLASMNNDSPSDYAKKILGQFIADRMYLLK